FSDHPAGRCSADPAVALAPPCGRQIDPTQDQGQVGDGEFDPCGARELRGARRGLRILEGADLKSLDVGITRPSFLWRYRNLVRSGWCRHESSVHLTTCGSREVRHVDPAYVTRRALEPDLEVGEDRVEERVRLLRPLYGVERPVREEERGMGP